LNPLALWQQILSLYDPDPPKMAIVSHRLPRFAPLVQRICCPILYPDLAWLQIVDHQSDVGKPQRLLDHAEHRLPRAIAVNSMLETNGGAIRSMTVSPTSGESLSTPGRCSRPPGRWPAPPAGWRSRDTGRSLPAGRKLSASCVTEPGAGPARPRAVHPMTHLLLWPWR